jgi:dTDP-4-amino-4,6-dideoxygalactose transaminase
MQVKFLDLRAAYESIQPEIEAAVIQSLRSGYYIGGPDVEQFEAAFAAYCGVDHCIGVANGLEALQLALAALDIGADDEVIVPSNTFIATWLAVSQCGAVCVPVEPDRATYNIDPHRIEAAITPRTRAIIPVHLYGQPAALAPIHQLARRHSLVVIEDAAQAHGAKYEGRRIGGHSELCTWSFYPGKNLGALGDAGAITTNDPEHAARLRLLRNYGSPVRYKHDERGFNSRLDPVQAAALRVKLDHLNRWNQRRAAIANIYQTEFEGLDLVLPTVLPRSRPVWHLYCVRHAKRNLLSAKLADVSVETLVHYPVPPYLQGAYASLGMARGSFPIAEELADSVLSLPIDPLMSDEQVSYVVEAVRGSVRALSNGS